MIIGFDPAPHVERNKRSLLQKCCLLRKQNGFWEKSRCSWQGKTWLFLGTNCVGEHWILACSNGWFWGFRMWCFKEGFYLPKHRLSLKGFPTLNQQTNQKLQGCSNKNPKALLQYLVSRWCLMRLEPDVRANVYNFPPDLRSNQALPQALVRSTSWKRAFFLRFNAVHTGCYSPPALLMCCLCHIEPQKEHWNHWIRTATAVPRHRVTLWQLWMVSLDWVYFPRVDVQGVCEAGHDFLFQDLALHCSFPFCSLLFFCSFLISSRNILNASV